MLSASPAPHSPLSLSCCPLLFEGLHGLSQLQLCTSAAMGSNEKFGIVSGVQHL